MKKEVIISEVLAKLDDLGVSYNIGKGTDVSINCEFTNANCGAGNKNIKYFASVYFNEAIKTVFMWELTKEKKNGFAFQEAEETFYQSGMTQFYRVNTTQYDIEGKLYEYTLDLGAIPKAFKDTAKNHGWSFKMVLKREKALYPLGYFRNTNKNYKESQEKDIIDNKINNYKQCEESEQSNSKQVLFWTLFIILLVFDLVLFIGGSGALFLILSSGVLVAMITFRKSFSIDVMKLLFSFLIAFMVTFIIFGFVGVKI